MAELSGNPTMSSNVDLNAGPPPPSRSPKKSTQSLFSKAGSDLQTAQSGGFGQEGGSPEMLALQGMSMIQKGVQTLSAIYPGITPLVSDILGRLQMALPALIQDMQNGGMGLVPMAGMPPQQPQAQPPMGGPMQPPMGGPVGPPGMGGQPGQPPVQ